MSTTRPLDPQGGGGGGFSGLLTSGIIVSGLIGNAAVNSGNIASGSVGWPHLASGAVRSGHIGDAAVVSGSISSGQVGWPHLSSGAVRSGHIGDFAVVSGSVASGQISAFATNFFIESAVVTVVGAAVTSILSIALADNTNYYLTAAIVGRRTDAADRAAYEREICVFRQGGGGATLQGVVATPFTRELTAAWNATLAVVGNNVEVNVNGVAASTINWYCRVQVTRVA